jgi:hypothetical protein
MTFNRYWLEPIIHEALQKLYKNDSYLIQHFNQNGRDAHVGERAIAFRFGIYLREIATSDDRLKNYDIDSEYNRCMDDPKYRTDTNSPSSPDLIIHRRGTNDDNLAIIEIKPYWSIKSKIDDDKEKLESFLKSPYKYTNALLLIIGKDIPKLCWV